MTPAVIASPARRAAVVLMEAPSRAIGEDDRKLRRRRGLAHPASVCPPSGSTGVCWHGDMVAVEEGNSGMAGGGEVLQVRRVRKSFESEGMPVRALRRVDLVLAGGEFVAV